MSLIVPSAVEVVFLQAILAEDYTLRLFTNTVVDSDDLTAEDFIDVAFPGYSVATLTGGGWTITAGSPTVGVYEAQRFVAASPPLNPETVRGYYVTHSGSGDLRWYEKFPEPVVVRYTADEIRITAQLTLADATG